MVSQHPRRHLPAALKETVRKTLAVLGEEISQHYGKECYREVESLRREMALLRSVGLEASTQKLRSCRSRLKQMNSKRRIEVAQSFALMMELMNACENAYRSYRLSQDSQKASQDRIRGAEEIVFVVTAHPTEARATATIPLFKKVQHLLKRTFSEGFESIAEELRPYIRLLLVVPLAPSETPTPEDEAEHLYRWILDPELLDTVLTRPDLASRVRFRAWAGGDKDGHPGINASVMLNSLSLSRGLIVAYLKRNLAECETLLKGAEFFDRPQWKSFYDRLDALSLVSPGDALRCRALQGELGSELARLRSHLGFDVLPFQKIAALSELFPCWVVPLELRESSDVLERVARSSDPSTSEEAIVGMPCGHWSAPIPQNRKCVITPELGS